MVKELITLSIDPAFDLDSPEDSDIVNYKLTRFDTFSIDLLLDFKHPERISPSLADRD